MKKLFAVLFSVFAVSGLYAQSGQYGRGHSGKDNHANGGYAERRMDDRYDRNTVGRGRDAESRNINRNFDQRNNHIRFTRAMNPRQKNKVIKSLERERQDQIKMVYRRFDERAVYADSRSRNRW